MITDIQKRTQNMLANRKEEVPKYTTHVEPKRLVPEDGDTSSQDNNFVVPPPPDKPWPEMETHVEPKRLVPEDGDTSSQDNNFDVLATPLATPSEAAEAAKDKGIIQLGLVAVVIAGTVGAYVWRNN